MTVLECVTDDSGEAFHDLVRHLRSAASDKGRSLSVEVTGEIYVDDQDINPDRDPRTAQRPRFDQLFALTRRRLRLPSWATRESRLVDTVNELTLALSRGRLVAIRTDMITPPSLLRWTEHPATPYKPLVPEVLEGTFRGNGTMVWLQGIHRRRPTLPDSKSLGGSHLQAAYDALDDASFAMTAMRINYVPTEGSAALRGQLTISADRSHLSSRAMQDLPTFIAAAEEALTMLEKTIMAERPPVATLPGYAVRERDLSAVSGAYDIRVLSPDEVLDEADPDDAHALRAQLLREALRDVRGQSGSPRLSVGVGMEGAMSTRVEIDVVPSGRNFELRADPGGRQPQDDLSHRVIDAIQNTDLLSVYYESGHTYTNRRIARQTVISPPFRGIDFRDFRGYDVKREKPAGRAGRQLHRNIARAGDVSLFAWVVKTYSDGWLICDDGAGEIADFLHLGEDNTLHVIHVKAAYSSSTGRGIAVTSFEQVVSQAEKNIGLLEPDVLQAKLLIPRNPHPACWTRGERVSSRSEFLARLAERTLLDKTYVVLVQPHLTEGACQEARAAAAVGAPSPDSFRLTLLDNLLHSTRRTITRRCDDLIVIGCA